MVKNSVEIKITTLVYLLIIITLFTIIIFLIIERNEPKIQQINDSSPKQNNISLNNEYDNISETHSENNSSTNKENFCVDECSISLTGYCDDRAFYKCEKNQITGCNEKKLIDFCGGDYLCTNNNKCESPTEESVFEIRSINYINSITETRPLEEGTDFSISVEKTKETERFEICTILKIIKGGGAIISCG